MRLLAGIGLGQVGLLAEIGLLTLARLPPPVRLVRLILVPLVLVPLPIGIGPRCRSGGPILVSPLIRVLLVRRVRQRIPG